LPRRINEDHNSFRDVVSGKIRQALKKFIKTGKIFKSRGKNGKVLISIPRIDIPHIVYGDNNSGVGRGVGKPGDVIGRDKNSGKGKGNKAGSEEAEGINISLDLEEVLKFLQDELELPDLKPKQDNTFEDIKIKYNNISLVGPESLRHTRRTMLTALKRMCSTGEANQLHEVPGCKDPIKLILPINSDKRYRQYKEIKTPSTNAIIIYARDGSASMDTMKCEIVSDMAWWIDIWIRKFYKRVERLFVWHDTVAQEVDEKKFYTYRFGGGTMCSSALKLIAKQFENRFPQNKWNIYLFYFTDGENMTNDNEEFVACLKKEFPEHLINFVGITQIFAHDYRGSVVEAIESAKQDGELSEYVKTTCIENTSSNLSGETRDEAVLKAIKELLGKKEKQRG
jgi:uncharacterized sporulation protein YeaH/YhbH (DUF444 family)